MPEPTLNSFWNALPRPILIQAPLENVTDMAFREMIAKYGKPGVMYTEFTSADGLASRGREEVLINFQYSEMQRPILAQIFGSNPKTFFEAGKTIRELGFDGIDINMGCPDKAVCKTGSGAALINTPALARELIEAVREGSDGLPISVKTRLGYNDESYETWVPQLLQANLASLTVHCRTKKELSLVPARWDRMTRIRELRDEHAPNTLLFGNGDLHSIAEAREKCALYDIDGAMLGRAIFGNPWLFSDTELPPIETRAQVLLEHCRAFEKYVGAHKSFAVMRKHFGSYISGFHGAKQLRVDLMETHNSSDVTRVLQKYFPNIT